MNNKRFVIKVGGESGQGINVTGEILGKALKEMGYKLYANREYPSLIKGGVASYQIDFSNTLLTSSSRYCDILACVSRGAVHEYLPTLNKRGILIHAITAIDLSENEQALIKKNKIEVIYLPAFDMAMSLAKTRLLSNIIMCGVIWKIIGLELKYLRKIVKKEFSDKPELLESDLLGVEAGYDYKEVTLPARKINFSGKEEWEDSLLMSGNQAIAMGAIDAGVRACITYPMTPATSIHGYLSSVYKKTKMLMKEAEDEICAAQMTTGSMFMGARTMLATSGGGFDLMTETVSLAGITETPFVCVIAQRPGPATGVPTWTGQGDLKLAINAGHGEFPRIVIATSDAISGYELIQKAYNLADQFQTVVLVLTEKQIAESLYNFKKLPAPQKIKRYLVEGAALEKLSSEDRYKLTDSGVSKRWLPGQSDADFLANSDEHIENGATTENGQEIRAMIDKRNQKKKSILDALPDPVIYGPEKADVSFIGWGSTKSAILDAINVVKGGKPVINYLHFDYVCPLKTEVLKKFMKGAKKLIIAEGNSTGQLAELIKQETGYEIKDKLLKYDGRPFFVEDILEKVEVK